MYQTSDINYISGYLPKVEYDVENSVEDDFRLIASDRIEQSAVPTCFSWYPPIIKEDFLLVVNDQVIYYDNSCSLYIHIGFNDGFPISENFLLHFFMSRKIGKIAKRKKELKRFVCH